MAGFDTDPAELFAAQAQLTNVADDGRVALTRLCASAEDVLGHGWTGAAAAAFGRGWQEWFGGAEQLLAALDELSRAFGVTAREYASAEQANTVAP